jgi:hypothetical protein
MLMCYDTKPDKHFGAPSELCTLTQFAQMAHDQIGHVLQEVHIIVADTVPWLVVKDTIGSDTSTAWRSDRNASVEACMRSLFHVRSITEPLVFKEVVDDMNFASILVVAIGSFVSFWYIDCVLTD